MNYFRKSRIARVGTVKDYFEFNEKRFETITLFVVNGKWESVQLNGGGETNCLSLFGFYGFSTNEKKK